jgi:hypothetical protein
LTVSQLFKNQTIEDPISLQSKQSLESCISWMKAPPMAIHRSGKEQATALESKLRLQSNSH